MHDQPTSTSTTDGLRILLGVAVVAAALAFAITSYLSGQRDLGDEYRTAAPTSDRVIAANNAGIEIESGGPIRNKPMLIAAAQSEKAFPLADARFSGGLYLDSNGKPISAYLVSEHKDGSLRTVAGVVDGLLEGPAIELHPSSDELKRAMTFRSGSLSGQYIEYFEDGQMKLRAMAGADSPNGGTLVSEITAGFFADGEYQRKSLGTGRMQFIFDDGTTNSTNQSIALDEQTGWMLFYDTMMSGQKAYTSDSRRIAKPDVGG